jgi:SAM-dependent methyltransferase
MPEHDWRALNRANWDERVAIHLGPHGYDLSDLRQGAGRLDAIVEGELPDVAGKRILHLQCHFGADTLRLARRGAQLVGLDFSGEAVMAARALAAETSLTAQAIFVEADLYDAPAAIPEPGGFDAVFVTWGALCWLPDIAGWARIVAGFLKPGGWLYLAEGHPAALVLDDAAPLPDGSPGFFLSYFDNAPLVFDDPKDYADDTARLANSETREWLHPLGAVVTALIDAGLRLDWLHEHDAVVWRMFKCQTKGPDGLYRWPGKPWLPLAYSLVATKPA